MLRIGIILSQPLHLSTGSDARIISLMESLSRLDTEIHLIAPFKVDIESFRGVTNLKIHKLKSPLYKSVLPTPLYSILRRLLYGGRLGFRVLIDGNIVHRIAESFATELERILVDIEIDVLQAEQQIAGLACARMSKHVVPVVVDLHGVWSQEMVEWGIVNARSSTAELLRMIEKEILQNASAVTVVSEEMKRFLSIRFNVPAGKIHVIRDGGILRIRKPKKFVKPRKIVHAGMLSKRTDPNLLLRAFALANARNNCLQFFLTEKGELMPYARKIARELGIAPTFFYFESRNALWEFLKSCDIGVAAFVRTTTSRMSYGGKIFSYMSVGLPVVVNDVGTWTKIVTEYDIGVVCENNPKSMADAVIQLAESPYRLEKCSFNAINAIRNVFNYDVSAKMLYNIYRRLT